MTSDTLDIRGPISLTRAGLQVRSVSSSTFVLCSLSPANVWHAPCARSKVLLVFGVSRLLPDKTQRQLKALSLGCDVIARTLQRSNPTRPLM
jgi:hypothetical protein